MELKKDKEYAHIPALISMIVTGRLEDRDGMQGPAVTWHSSVGGVS